MLVEIAQTSFHEKKTQCRQWPLIFCLDVHMGMTPPTPRPPESDPSLRVSVVNGLPLRGNLFELWKIILEKISQVTPTCLYA